MNKNSKILVTGANGHVGFNLVKMLLDKGYKVRASVRNNYDESKTSRLKKLGVKNIVSLDIQEEDAFIKTCNGIDVLFHVAATYKYHTSSKVEDQEMIKDSLVGVQAAMNAAEQNKVGQVILTSSIVTLPTIKPGEPLPNEASWRTDLSVPYMRAKTEAEQLAWKLAEEKNVNLATILPGAIIGPNFGRGTPTTDIILAIIMGSMRIGTIDNIFPVLDVRDIVEAHILAAEQDATGRFIIGADEEPTFSDIIEVMRKIDASVPKSMMVVPKLFYPMLPMFDWLSHKTMGTPRTMTRELINTIGDTKMIANNQRAKDVLGWSQKIDLETSLRATMTELAAHTE